MDRYGFGRRAWRGREYTRERTGEPRWRGRYGWDPYEQPTWRGTAYGEERDWRGREYDAERGAEPAWREREFGYDRPYGRSSATFGEGWTTPGPYTGVGPRGYTRSDDRICEDVCVRLTQHGQIDATAMEVTVENGEVTLTGTVDSRREKRMADDVAESVSGVRDVHNRLRIRPQQQQWTQEERPSATATRVSPGMVGRSRVQADMEVFGANGENVGRVKEVRDGDFLLDRPMTRDLYVPFDAVSGVSGDRVTLAISAADVDSMGWANPPLMGETTETG